MTSAANLHERSSETITLCTVWAGTCQCAFDLLDIREINTDLEITPVPHANPGISGLVNIRGQVALVANLSEILGREPSASLRPMLVLFKERVGPAFGVLVDRVGTMVTVERRQIVGHSPESNARAQALSDRAMQVTTGVCKLSDGLALCIDPRAILSGLASGHPLGATHD